MEMFGIIEPGGLMDQFIKQKLKESTNEAFDNVKHIITLLQDVNTLLDEIPEQTKQLLNLGFVASLYVGDEHVFTQTTGTYGALKAIVKDTENLVEEKYKEEEKKHEETINKLKELLRKQSDEQQTHVEEEKQ